jgi:hypothetical protein
VEWEHLQRRSVAKDFTAAVVFSLSHAQPTYTKYDRGDAAPGKKTWREQQQQQQVSAKA